MEMIKFGNEIRPKRIDLTEDSHDPISQEWINYSRDEYKLLTKMGIVKEVDSNVWEFIIK